MEQSRKPIVDLAQARALRLITDYGEPRMHLACDVCGCRIFLKVQGGQRCAWCYPPLRQAQQVREIVGRTFNAPTLVGVDTEKAKEEH